MKQLEQLRAAHALQHVGDLPKEAVNGLPGLILANGLLGTLAFCSAESSGANRGSQAKALQLAADFLAEQQVLPGRPQSLEQWIDTLCKGSAAELQQVTDEVLAYLAYLKRFARKQSRQETSS